MIGIPFLTFVIRRLSRYGGSGETSEREKVNFAKTFHHNLLFLPPLLRSIFSIEPMQDEEEISQFLELLKSRGVRRLLEIGTANGGTLYLFSRALPKGSTLISIDSPTWPVEGGYPSYKQRFYQSFSKSQELILLRVNSHDELTVKRVRDLLQGRKLDSLFIDGDHSYEGVKADFEMLLPLVSEEGIVAFHDIHSSDCPGVRRFWSEISQHYDHWEILHAGANEVGIGCISLHQRD
jgi:predicted O-methyltransferase YrrM